MRLPSSAWTISRMPGVQIASSVKAGQDLSFRISGTGVFPARIRRRMVPLQTLLRGGGQSSGWRIGAADRCARRAGKVSLVDSWSLGRVLAAELIFPLPARA